MAAAQFNPNLIFIEENLRHYKIFSLQGGTRSGKTYSAIQFILRTSAKYRGLCISVCRKSMPVLRATAYRDFLDILKESNLYSSFNHNKTLNEYYLNGNVIEFFGLDEEQKVRGRKRDILFVNEANEISFDEWQQLLFRTTGKIIIDYNPSMNDSWIYDKVLQRTDCGTLITTYKDNPHLPASIVEEIERTKETDENTWKIYGLGERGITGGEVFAMYALTDVIPPDWKRIYGLDFGYNVPTALVEVGYKENTIVANECLYQRGMTNSMLITFLRTSGVNRRAEIYADAAEPDRIQEIYDAGFNCHAAKKDIAAGIDSVKAHKLLITNGSKNILAERKTYKYKVDRNGNTLDEPVDFNDHAMDAMRYAVFTHLQGRRIIKPATVSVPHLKRKG